MSKPASPQQPPIFCKACLRGPSTVYAPSLARNPDYVSARRREVRHIHDGRTVVKEGEKSEGVFVLYSGWAFRFKQLADGRRQILSFLLPGDLVLLEALLFPQLAMPCSVKSLTAISLCVFPHEAMAEILAHSPEQRLALETEMQRYLGAAEARLTDLGRRSALGRMSAFLLETKERLERLGLVQNGGFDFPPSQHHLADALGLTPPYVNRTLAHLRTHGIATITDQRVTIQNEAELRHLAGEE